MSGSDWDFTKFVDPPRTPSGSLQPTGDPLTTADSSSPPPDTGDIAFAAAGSGAGDGITLTTGRAPVRWLFACLGAVLVGGSVAAALGATSSWAIAAWVLSGPIAIGLLAAFTAFDTRARTKGIYSQQAWVKPLYVVCLVLCGIAVCLAALRIAVWVGRW